MPLPPPFRIPRRAAQALALVLVLAVSGCVSSGADKALHFSATGLISALATCLASEDKAIAAGAATGLGAGLAKEVYDSRPGGSGFDGADLAADALGTGVGTFAGYRLCHAGAAPR